MVAGDGLTVCPPPGEDDDLGQENVPTFPEVAVVGGRLGFAPLKFEVVPVFLVDSLPAATLTVAAHSEGQDGRKSAVKAPY